MTPSVFALLVLLGGLYTRGAAALRMQLLFCQLGAAAAITLDALGGAIITPAVLFLPFLVWRAGSEPTSRLSLRSVPPAGFWLALVGVWGALGAVLLPRIF